MRITSNQWALVNHAKDEITTASTSQELYKATGLLPQDGSGKLSTAQAVWRVYNNFADANLCVIKDGVWCYLQYAYEKSKGQAEFEVIEITEKHRNDEPTYCDLLKVDEPKAVDNEPKETPKSVATDGADITALADALRAFVGGGNSVDEEKVRALIKEEVAKLNVPRTIKVVTPKSTEPKSIGHQHKQFKEVLDMVTLASIRYSLAMQVRVRPTERCR